MQDQIQRTTYESEADAFALHARDALGRAIHALKELGSSLHSDVRLLGFAFLMLQCCVRNSAKLMHRRLMVLFPQLIRRISCSLY